MIAKDTNTLSPEKENTSSKSRQISIGEELLPKLISEATKVVMKSYTTQLSEYLNFLKKRLVEAEFDAHFCKLLLIESNEEIAQLYEKMKKELENNLEKEGEESTKELSEEEKQEEKE